jgi:hypothetical protein
MKSTLQRLFILGLALVLLTGCASSGPSGSSEHDAGQVALCDLNDDLIGWKLTTDGTVSFTDFSPPDGVFFELRDAGCEVGAFAHNDFWNNFSPAQQDLVWIGSAVRITGILTKDQDQLVVSVQELAEAP